MYTKMETTFYDDSLNAFSQHDAAGGFGFGHAKALKHSLTLNLADPARVLKQPPQTQTQTQTQQTQQTQQQLQQQLQQARAKPSDLLTSPELERLIIQSGNGLITTTPTPTPTHFMCPKNVTDEQEGFAEGFVRALAELHHQHMPGTAGASAASGPRTGAGAATYNNNTNNTNTTNNTTTNTSSSVRADSPVYEDLSSFHPGPGYPGPFPAAAAPQLPVYAQPSRLAVLKEEPQTVPEMPGDTPPLSPIDMENQERIKAERKRMRNRVAASKCRKRKLERISRLEDKVKNLKCQNSELASTANMLREQVAQLKQKVMNHVNSGCQLMLTQQLQTF